ncbi:MAG: family 20 glycosylhydrolase [Bacteroidales bacterium]|nr:family 20 glycosylhydrolase [Bacteroidales bacterium]
MKRHIKIWRLGDWKIGRLEGLLIILLALLTTSCDKTVQVSEYSIIPEPVYLVQKGRTFTLSSHTQLRFENMGQNTPTAKYVTNRLRQMHIRPALIGRSKKPCITLTINDTANTAIGDEGYLVQVTPDGITLSANTEAGLFYAFQTFLQMLPEDVSQASYKRVVLPECTILDYPRFAWRGSHLDVCRHFFDVKQIEKHLDLMASYKLNKFHWHLTDDQGWRIEIEKYPELNDIGSWHVDRTDQRWGKETPAKPGEEPTYGGYYTKKEIAEVVEYAAQRNIEVIPEIDIPGHCSAMLAAYPELSCDGGEYTVAVGPYWPPKAILCAGEEKTLQMLCDILDEVAECFPSEFVHIGGDEAMTDNWQACPKCQAQMRRNNLRDEKELQGWFLAQVQEHLSRKGRRIIGWDEILDHGHITTNAVVMSWRGDSCTYSAAIRGHDVISANPKYCNLEFYQGDSLYHPLAFPQFLDLLTCYMYDPMPKGLTEQDQAHVWGGECILWTDYITHYSQAEYQLLPRLCALSECLWSMPDRKDWGLFQKKIEHHKTRLKCLGYNCCKGSFKPYVTAIPDGNGAMVSIMTEVDGSYIYYTTDGSKPTPESQIYQSPIRLPRGTHLRTITLYRGEIQEGIYDFHF